MFHLKNEALKGFIKTYKKDFYDAHDPLMTLTNSYDEIFTILNEENVRVRFLICICITFQKMKEKEVVQNKFYFSSKAERLLSVYEIKDKIKSAFEKILNNIEDFLNHGSGWQIKTVDFIEVHIGKYYSLKGGCRSVSLPNKLRNKKAILNIKCNDDMCFIYAILAALFPKVSNKNLQSSYEKYKIHLSYGFLNFPVQVSDVPKFEQKNKLKINIYGFKDVIFPIYKSKCATFKELDLLLFKNHYCLITNFNKLMHEKHGIHKFCKNCLVGFARQSTLNEHERMCLKNLCIRIVRSLVFM